MEEDVKKCETLLGSERWVLGTQDKKALENLIKGYRELKEINESFIWQSNFDMKFYEENYIPKSRVKEKIEDLNNYDSEFCQRVINHNEHTLTEFVQNILQELMEDK